MAYRIFIAHPKSYDDETLAALVAGLKKELEQRNPTFQFELTLGRDDFEARGMRLGWDDWARSISAVTDPISRTPRFNAVFVPCRKGELASLGGIVVGKATIQICDHARKAGTVMRAYVMDAELGHRLLPIDGARTISNEDYKAGWVLEVGPEKMSG